MKRIFRPTLLATAIVCGLSTVSCKDYLDVEPTAYDSPEYVFSTVSGATSAVVGVYDMMQGDQGYGIRLNLYFPYDTDEMLSSPGASDAGRRGVARYGATPSNSELLRPWNNLYQGIERANICLEYIPKMSNYQNGAESAALKRLHGEVLVLRAQYFYELVRNWGDVPAPFEATVAGSDLKIPKTDRNVILDQLLKDLDQAAGLLPWRTESGTNNERITKGAAKALRARVALARAGYYPNAQTGQMQRASDYATFYPIVRDECRAIMARTTDHALNPDFSTVWRTIGNLGLETNEVLFQVGAGGGNSNSDSKLGYYNGPRMNASPTYGSTNGAITALPNYFYAFDSVDTRRDISVTKYTIESDDKQKATDLLKLTDGKFRRDWRQGAAASAQNLGFNWPLIRFSDVLLMFAEAENEISNGPTAEARTAFEQVRRRAYKGNESKIGTTPTSKQGFFDALVRERYLEFGGEGIRKYDLIRWNLLGPKITETKATLTAMQAETGSGAYARVPQYMYYRVVGSEVQFLNSFYKPSPATAPTVPGATVVRINWRQALVGTTATTFISNVAAEYRAGAGRELLPIPQSVIDTNPNVRQNFGY